MFFTYLYYIKGQTNYVLTFEQCAYWILNDIIKGVSGNMMTYYLTIRLEAESVFYIL